MGAYTKQSHKNSPIENSPKKQVIENKNGGILPHARRTECAKIQISQSDFSNLTIGKNVNICSD